MPGVFEKTPDNPTTMTLRNFRSSNDLDHRTVVGFDTGNAGGAVKLNAGTSTAFGAGVVLTTGLDTTNGVPLAYVPQNQTLTIQYHGVVKIRATAVAIAVGDKVYAVPASGKLTNSAGGNVFVGVALTPTAGVLDELCTVRLNLMNS